MVTLLALIEVAVALRLLQIEKSQGLPRLVPVVVVGFAIHQLLPLRFRIPFFLLLGAVASTLLFGVGGTAFIAIGGLALVGACHLPLSFEPRLFIIAVMTAGFAVVRVGWVHLPEAGLVLPILASMFMFRLIIYLYDLRHERQPVPIQTRLAYFFLLPNLVFPLFPVVDYQMFVRSHYRGDADAIHRKGVGWILLGVLHVLAYRLVHLYLVPDEALIDGPEPVALWVVGAYLQYLRISGMFHIAAGILCLFGFDLPATNKWFFFASSYTDLWRRINVYWKDFLQKIVYFPVFMRFRKQGMTRGMVLATIAVFVSSWALHAWQWFWLNGEVLLTDVDLAFWALVGAAVVVSALTESGASRKPAEPTSPLRQAVAKTGRMALIFGFTAVLWSLWSSGSLDTWWFVLSQVQHGSATSFATVGLAAAGVIVVGVGLNWLHGAERLPDLDALLQRGGVLVGGGALLLLLGVAAPRLPEDSALVAVTLESSQGPVGYYEELIGREAWKLPTDDLRPYRIRPGASGYFRGRRFTTNEHGMRDSSVSLERVPGVTRIAVLGASPEMGWGVGDGQDFPALLDADYGPSIEVLNFAGAGYSPVANVSTARMAMAFQPDLLLLFAHCDGDRHLTRETLRTLYQEDRLPPGLHQFADRHIASQTRQGTRWAYDRIAQIARDGGAVPVWIFLPLPRHRKRCDAPPTRQLARWARDAGLDTLVLGGVYQGHVRRQLALTDGHPTPKAHRVIADHLRPKLQPWIDGLKEE